MRGTQERRKGNGFKKNRLGVTKRKKEGEVGAGGAWKCRAVSRRTCWLVRGPGPHCVLGTLEKGSTNTTLLQSRQSLSYPTTSPLWNNDQATNVIFGCSACFPCLALMNEDAAQNMGLRSQRDTQRGGVTGPGITRIKSRCRENISGPLGLVLCVGGPGTECLRVSHPATM